ncbi:hypothetical protein PVAP13_7NG021600 [Panicum virgatum]|uniref:Uncharacterized protein n=1 Tax=Panicum virgatum TaxID=38727 RepID=A0A8T0PR45_PANVG|nr:hypothetical protein PVAP13_7NG021600 [Panicum virgatum]KAG2564827.1 hypothetical protein PVAP13_7NG021600 [Panicum virgatum]
MATPAAAPTISKIPDVQDPLRARLQDRRRPLLVSRIPAGRRPSVQYPRRFSRQAHCCPPNPREILAGSPAKHAAALQILEKSSPALPPSTLLPSKSSRNPRRLSHQACFQSDLGKG